VKRTEDVLHVQVWRMLRSLLPADAVAWSSESRGVGGEEGGRRKARGVIAGTPDLQVMYCGRTLFIELKAPRGSVSGEQRHLHDRLRRAGFSVAVCRSIEDVVGALERFGIPLRGRIAA
jgi:hypothetical protein